MNLIALIFVIFLSIPRVSRLPKPSSTALREREREPERVCVRQTETLEQKWVVYLRLERGGA